jgi:signal transduction histidine kinase
MTVVRDLLTDETISCPELAALIDRLRIEIAALWTDRIITRAGTHYGERARDEVFRWARDGLQALRDSLATGSSDSFQRYIETIGRSRLQLGFEMQEVVQAWLLIKDILTPIIIEEMLEDRNTLWTAISCLDSNLRLGTARFVSLHREHLLAAYRQLTETLLEKQGYAEVLQTITSEALRLTGGQSTAILLIDEFDDLYTAVESGTSIHDLSTILNRVIPVSDQPVPEQAYYLNTLQEEVSDGSCSVSTLLVAPLRLRSRGIGVLLAMNHPAGFNDDDLRAVRFFADQAAIALEYAHLNEQHEKLAILEERQKLARDLHDSVSQSLYAVTLYAEASTRLLAEEETAKAMEHIIQLRDAALTAMREMRLLVYELRPHVLADDGLITMVRNRLQTVEERVGIETAIDCSGFERLPLEIEEGLHGIIHEALNNTLKHTTARSIAISVHLQDDTVRADIRDDGEGFDPAEGFAEGGLGLTGMQERARTMNATLEIQSSTGQGTHIQVVIPLKSGVTEHG